MDIKQYIESGIIESYVLGTASDQERREVECLSHIYPELKEEILSSQNIVEQYVVSLAKTPPIHIKASLFEKIKVTPQEGTIKPLQTENVENKPSIKNAGINRGLKISLAASIMLLIGLGSILYVTIQSKNNINAALQNKQQQIKTLEKKYALKLNGLTNDLAELIAVQSLILDQQTKTILLKGTNLNPDAKAKVYYHSTTSQIVYAGLTMPVPTTDKQYQLWAISNGTPIDLGVISKDSAVFKLKINPQTVEAFAITLEPDGGSKTPTLDQLYVIGNV